MPRTTFSAALLLGLVSTTSCTRARPYTFEGDPLYVAVKKFDPQTYEVMLRRVQSIAQRAPVREDLVDAELAPLVRKVKRTAFRVAPDAEVVAYVESEFAAAKAVAVKHPETCEQIILDARLLADEPDGGVRLSLDRSVQESIKQASTRLIRTARDPGPHTPALSEQESSERNHRDIARYEALKMPEWDPNAPAEQRCRALLVRFQVVDLEPEPERARGMRYMRGGAD